jgi:hypothetical protein
MERVWEILLEVENLSTDERARVQDGLATIRSDTKGSSANADADSAEVFSDLAVLIDIRHKHQCEEEAKAVRVARAHGKSNDDSSEQDSEGVRSQRMPAAAALQDSERRQLAKKINDIIKASMAVPTVCGESTGLNHHVRWNVDKVAAGSTLPVDSEGAVKATGNKANAQATARKAAQSVRFLYCNDAFAPINNDPLYSQVMSERHSAFALLKNADSLASAKISTICPITNKSFGFAVLDDSLIMVEGTFKVIYFRMLSHHIYSAYNV